MKPMIGAGGATALALVLLFCATAPAVAHEAHKKKAAEVLREQPPIEEPALHNMPIIPAKEEPHDHAQHGQNTDSRVEAGDAEAPASNLPKPIAWLGKFHPPITHFPIALLISAALAEFLFMRTGTVAYRHALLFCVRIGAGAAMFAAVLGWFFAGVRLVDEEWVMTAHRWAGTSLALFSVWLLYLAEQLRADEPTATPARFRIALFSAAGLVGATGFLGSALLYGLDHYAWWV
jgi:uncharacterized membrane protein